jgi:hypothetical protein
MKKLIIAGAMAVALGSIAVPAEAQSAKHILRGAGIGAAGGVIAGALIPGLGIGTGALIGAAGGTLVNTLDKGHKRYHHPRHRYHRRHR